MFLMFNGYFVLAMLERFAPRVWRRDGELVVVIMTLEALHVRVLGHSAATVEEVTRVSVGRLSLVLGLDDDVTVLGRHLHVRWIDVARELQVHLDLLVAVLGVHDLGPHALGCLSALVHLVRDVDHERAIVAHEARQFLLLHELRQVKRALERAMRKVLVALALIALAARHDQLVATDLGLDRLGIKAGTVHGNTVLLRHLWLHERSQRRTIEPVDHVVELHVELVEGIEYVQCARSQCNRSMPQVLVEHATREECVRY